jgi:hypothetical protein
MKKICKRCLRGYDPDSTPSLKYCGPCWDHHKVVTTAGDVREWALVKSYNREVRRVLSAGREDVPRQRLEWL